MSKRKYDREQFKVGCYVDESAGSAETLDKRIVRFAQHYGFKPGRNWWRGDFVNEVSDQAVEFLNSLETRTAIYWDVDDNSLFLRGDVESAKEQCEFVSSREQEDPPDDFTGEWLHVNDHGNCTLYFRDTKGNDREQWSMV